MPAAQTGLLDQLLVDGARVTVVLSHGSVVRVSDWAPRVAALVQAWLPGQAGGSAIARVLFGRCDPGGRLAQTVPVRLQDTSDYLDFPGEEREVIYGEGIFVGYRWYDARDLPVAFPFGHGLSYTTFGYADASVTLADDTVRVELSVINTGERDGADVVQVYAGLSGSQVRRAPRELRGFAKVQVAAGARQRVRIDVPVRDLAYFSTTAGDWHLEGGAYEISIGASSRDIRWTGLVQINGDDPVFPITLDSSVQEWLADPTIGAETRALLKGTLLDPEGPMATLLAQNSIGSLAALAPDLVDQRLLEEMACRARAAVRG